MKKSKRLGPSGFTMIELLVIVSIMAVLLAVPIMSFRGNENSLVNATNETIATLRRAKSTATSSTSAVRVRPASTSTFLIESNQNSCATSTGWTTETSFAGIDLQLPNNVTFDSTTWVICFNTRGLAPNNGTIVLNGPNSRTRTIGVYLGGDIRPL